MYWNGLIYICCKWFMRRIIFSEWRENVKLIFIHSCIIKTKQTNGNWRPLFYWADYCKSIVFVHYGSPYIFVVVKLFLWCYHFNYTFHWIISKKVSSKVWLKIIIDRVIVDQGDCFKLSIHLRQVLNWFYIHFYYYYYLCNAFEIYW